jgi:hypothetical protein
MFLELSIHAVRRERTCSATGGTAAPGRGDAPPSSGNLLNLPLLYYWDEQLLRACERGADAGYKP